MPVSNASPYWPVANGSLAGKALRRKVRLKVEPGRRPFGVSKYVKFSS